MFVQVDPREWTRMASYNISILADCQVYLSLTLNMENFNQAVFDNNISDDEDT